MELDRWLRIEMRHFAALQAVAGQGTFRGAAKRLGYTQSAISQQIATLERVAGTKLVERPGGPRAVYLTDAGRLVLRHAEAIMARLNAAQGGRGRRRRDDTRRRGQASNRPLPERRLPDRSDTTQPLQRRLARGRGPACRVGIGP